ncbi:MAG: hypothetical protein GPJ50_12420 [Candidatus Heimdallarchaeota archaeon]|nr:hypothetical protein [Candidatus Heimdallarchaeota archaeon]
MLEAEAAVKEAAEVAKEVIEEITATPEPTPTYQELIAKAVEELAMGQILFNPPQKMKVGVKKLVEVRLTQNTTEEMTEELRKGLKGRGGPQIEKIEVGTCMNVSLTGDNFDINPLSSEEQVIRPEGFTEWSWNVKPVESGTQVLHLKVTARLLIPGQAEQELDCEVMHKNISVDVNPAYSIKCFIESHWMWIVGTIITIVIAAIGIRKKRGE